ncbi:MAG: hypothetical protein ACFFB5_16775 [Promethearchaeota archaeon]
MQCPQTRRQTDVQDEFIEAAIREYIRDKEKVALEKEKRRERE